MSIVFYLLWFIYSSGGIYPGNIDNILLYKKKLAFIKKKLAEYGFG